VVVFSWNVTWSNVLDAYQYFGVTCCRRL